MSDSKRIHFIGIAGSGMSGLAILAKSQGHQVSGSDRQRSKYLDAVEANGIAVSFDQGPANITPDIDIVVASTAIRAENPELKAAVDLGLDVWPRAKMLAWLGRDLQTWAVAGTHGKTTTSSMLASALNNMGADPSFVIGGVLTEFQSSARLGTGQDYVVEADESDESFTMLSPSVAIVTNIEMDHLDHFHSLDEIDEAFSRFIDTLGEDGLLVYCIDDPELAEIARQSDKRKASYGFSASAKYRCQSLDAQNFVVHFPDGQASVTLPYSPGAHNVLNATASLAALVEMGYAAGPSAKAVSGFKGVGRRFELVGEGRGVQVFDDYGHHPTEIKATLSAAQALGFNHTHVLFQPHRYSRTHELFDSFVEAFDDADTLTLLDIYSAGEDPVAGISSQALVEAINTAHPGRDVRLLDREDAPGYLASLAKPGDLIITIGAGDVTLLAPLIVEALGEPPDDGEPPDEGGSLDDGEPPDDGGSLPTDGGGSPDEGGSPASGGPLPPVASQAAPPLAGPSPVSWTVPIFEAYCELEGVIRGSLSMNEPMARHTSFRIGGPAGLFIECDSIADLKTSMQVIGKYGLSWVLIGKGTNLLVSDNGFEGAVLTLGKEFKSYAFPEAYDGSPEAEDNALLSSSMPTIEYPSEKLVAGGGVLLGNLVRNAFKNGYSGLEFAVGIPGTVGGAVFMNAGTAEDWISSVVSSVLVFNLDGELVRYSANDLPWAYRSSGLQPGEIVLETELIVQKGNTSYIRARMEGIMSRRQKSQPLSKPSAGSVFKNPEGVSAGQLIDALGLKGLAYGGASVSEVHANFIVNNGTASAQNVIDLIRYIRKKVREAYGFELQTEIRFIGFT